MSEHGVVRKHYNYPLTWDRYRFVHYYRNGEPWRFRLRCRRSGLTTIGFGVTAVWILWPEESRKAYQRRVSTNGLD